MQNNVEITRLTPNHAEARPYRASVVTRDENNQLVGVRILRAHRAPELEQKIAELRGTNARDDIANQPKGA